MWCPAGERCEHCDRVSNDKTVLQTGSAALLVRAPQPETPCPAIIAIQSRGGPFEEARNTSGYDE
jgi:hypothetical protein